MIAIYKAFLLSLILQLIQFDLKSRELSRDVLACSEFCSGYYNVNIVNKVNSPVSRVQSAWLLYVYSSHE